MAYYAALVSVVQTLDEIIHRDQCKKLQLNIKQIVSVHKKFSLLQASLEDHWPKDREATDVLEIRIRDAAYEAKDIIETQISKTGIYSSKVPKPLLELEKVKKEVDSIVEELMRIKMESPTPTVRDEEELQLKKSDISADASSLVHAVRLLEEICHSDQFPNSSLDKEQIAPLLEKFKFLQELLDRDESADFLEMRIGDVASQTLDIIKTHISNHKRGALELSSLAKEYQHLEKVKKDANSIIVDEMVRIKVESLTAHEDNSHVILYSANSAGPSTQAPIDRTTLPLPFGESSELEAVATVDSGLISVVQLLAEISHHNRYPSSHLDKAQIASLHERFKLLQELLDLEELAAGFLERRIEDVKYQVQDIIEAHISDQSRQPHCLEEIIDKVKRAFWQLISACQNTKSLQVHEDLEKLKFEVDSIVDEMIRIKMEGCTTYDSTNIAGPSRQGHSDRNTTVGFDEQLGTQAPTFYSSYVRSPKVQASGGRSTMVGCDEHLRTIKEQLCGQSLKLEVISIVGMGGIGKTSLAKNIFDDKLIDDRFDYRAWVIISQDYHPRNVLQAMVSSLKIEVKEEVFLGNYIYKHLKGRRYLIIMDDVWDTKVWDDIKRVLPDDHNGSRIMITTRQSDVASYASTSTFINHISLLNEHQSWYLFCEKASCPPELEDIGMLIAKNCRGLPLAIVVVAGLLSNPNMTQNDWKEIARGISSTVAKTDEHFSKILSLSYNHLPHHLKPCFLYLGGFPKDYEICISKLMKLWVAEGFLKPLESKCFEEAAEKYFEELVNRNLVMITKWGSSGKFKYCVIHDLLRDMCLERARYEKFHSIHSCKVEEEFHEEAIRNVRRLDHIPKVPSLLPMDGGKKCVYNARYSCGANWSQPFDSRFLRVLDAKYTNFALGFLIEHLHLRFVACSSIDSLSSIYNLKNLQTLVIKGAYQVLFFEIWKMPHLRHVMIERVRLPPIPTHGIIKKNDGVPLLGMLQTLSTVVNFTFIPYAVEMIPNVKKLKIRLQYLQHRKNPWEKFGFINLIHLRQLEKLEIVFNTEFEEDISGEYKSCEYFDLPENFAFPLSLKKLNLKGCQLHLNVWSAVSSLPNLQILKLKSSNKRIYDIQLETKEGEFPKLKYLEIDGFHYFSAGENTSFPCLERIILRWCRSREFPYAIADVPTLELIELEYCRSALGSSALRIQEEQRELGNNILQVHVHNEYRELGERAWSFVIVDDEDIRLGRMRRIEMMRESRRRAPKRKL